MDFPELFSGEFVRRENRFLARVRLDGRVVAAHLANSGRLTDLLTPGTPVWVAPAGGPQRKTACDIKLVEQGEVLVSVDARLPAGLFVEALQAGKVPGFNPGRIEREVRLGQSRLDPGRIEREVRLGDSRLDPGRIEREVRLGDSRLDLRLHGSRGTCWVETKSVTLVEEGVALFPDAPTRRGQKHLHELVAAVRGGDRAAVAFIVQRPDARSFAPHPRADPNFTAGLRQAAACGVLVKAYTCQVTRHAITLLGEIPVQGV